MRVRELHQTALIVIAVIAGLSIREGDRAVLSGQREALNRTRGLPVRTINHMLVGTPPNRAAHRSGTNAIPMDRDSG